MKNWLRQNRGFLIFLVCFAFFRSAMADWNPIPSNNSAESRYIGVVPGQRLIGRAHHVLVSADINGTWLPRLERFGEQIR